MERIRRNEENISQPIKTWAVECAEDLTCEWLCDGCSQEKPVSPTRIMLEWEHPETLPTYGWVFLCNSCTSLY